jgi:hypothetical protein
MQNALVAPQQSLKGVCYVDLTDVLAGAGNRLELKR